MECHPHRGWWCLGRALLAYRGFDSKGFHIAAVFDSDPAKVGTNLTEYAIRSLSELESTIRQEHVRLAILAVPADVAQEMADQLVAAGIRGLLNFAVSPQCSRTSPSMRWILRFNWNRFRSR